ncbi:nuclease-related domain-containing protein [Proteinivorax tanatarense]|uniref:Nuclease-related domain-containing protein n=1 Tax=Proteinivorax tanatarense TaxID=1260629 RepID=A0AAU7VLA5_9FIRM
MKKIAIIKTKESSLKKQRNEHLKMSFWGVISFITLIILGLVFIQDFYVLAVIPIIFSIYQFNKGLFLNHGIKGEKVVLKKLKKLSDDYIVYNDITIKNKGEQAQIDHLVIGPKGVFCIETKNMKGDISGRETDHNWVQKKTGKRGGIYHQKFYNPCKQNGRHVYKLKGYLNSNNLSHVWVQSVVVFTKGWSSKLDVESNTPVLKDGDLIKFITSYKNQKGQLSSKIINDLENAIDKNIGLLKRAA